MLLGGATAIGVLLIAAGSGARGLGGVFLVAAIVGLLGSETARRRGWLTPCAFARVYDAAEGEVFRALHSAIEQLGYHVTSLDAQQRDIAFNTGISLRTWSGQDFTGSVASPSPGRSEVRLVGVTSQRGLGSIQAITWGETDRLGNRVLDRVGEELKTPSAHEPTYNGRADQAAVPTWLRRRRMKSNS